MKATEVLSNEHKVILKVIGAMQKECDSAEKKGKINAAFFEKAVSFIKNYADRFHHAKEEDILFKEMQKGGALQHCNPVEQMLYEHSMGRDFVKGMESGLKSKDREKIIENARGYASLLQEHIFKEDNILYPMAEDALSRKTKQAVAEKFEKLEKTGKARKYMEIAKELQNL